MLPKTLALPVFASDPLSSNAYATEEILLVLAAAGSASFWLVTPLSIVIALVVVIVITSYRQTVHAYPSGGGSYLVARENLGTNYGLTAAAALLTDYVLTVAVSVVAGVAAITSVAPGLAEHRVLVSIAFVVLVMLANLRGVRESGAIFAVPTYLFVFSIWALLVVGAFRCLGSCPRVPSADLPFEATSALTLFLVLRAFASGSTALTGIEAISNGVGAFKRPQARNASATLAIMGGLTLSMFLGISFLARATGVHPITAELAEKFGLQEMTVIAQIAQGVFGGGFFFYLIQATTAAILILAANTAYADFPRLSAILARDRFMPRQFMTRGDRLVFSNGILILSVLASLLIWAFDASVTRLIQLYVVGVFTTFTLSQAGMVARWRRLRPAGWRFKAVVNGAGAATTGLVLIVVAATKFLHGAWLVMIAMPLIVLGFRAINRHYSRVAEQLRRTEDRPRLVLRTRVVLLVARIDEATMRALGYARAMRPLGIQAVHVGRGEQALAVKDHWDRQGFRIPMVLLEGDHSDIRGPIRSFLSELVSSGDELVTVLIPEVVSRSRFRHVVKRRRTLLLKASLLFIPRVVVTDVPLLEESGAGGDRRPVAPTRVVGVIPVSAVHNATLRAVAYARGLSPTRLEALIFNVESEETAKVFRDWAVAVGDVSLEAIDSPYRDIAVPLVRYVRQVYSEYPGTVVSVIVPEFVVPRWWQHFLHNQTALAIKAALQFEPNVTLTSVPFHLS